MKLGLTASYKWCFLYSLHRCVLSCTSFETLFSLLSVIWAQWSSCRNTSDCFQKSFSTSPCNNIPCMLMTKQYTCAMWSIGGLYMREQTQNVQNLSKRRWMYTTLLLLVQWVRWAQKVWAYGLRDIKLLVSGWRPSQGLVEKSRIKDSVQKWVMSLFIDENAWQKKCSSA